MTVTLTVDAFVVGGILPPNSLPSPASPHLKNYRAVNATVLALTPNFANYIRPARLARQIRSSLSLFDGRQFTFITL